MPRVAQAPRLYLQTGKGRKPLWIIRDGIKSIGTGCDECDRAQAETKLAEYILAKHDPAKAINYNNPNATKIADILAVEMRRVDKRADLSNHRKSEFISLYQHMGNWFGHRVVGDLNGDLQDRYAQERKRFISRNVSGELKRIETDQPAPGAAYRDLKLLQGAINRYFKRNVGGIVTQFSAVLPDAPHPRERCLTRDEAAKLIWTAWRARKATKLEDSKGRLTSRHIARYILVGLYTGSRNGDICGAAVIPTIGRGYVDLDRGIFKRKPDNKKATSKQQPTIPIPPRLLAHMRRWKRLGISRQAVIEFDGKPVNGVRDGWATLIEKAGFASDDPRQKIVPHTLRHTAITWYLTPDRRTGRRARIEDISLYCGVSERIIRETYKHVMAGTFDEVMAASQNFGR
jgi:integrase